MKDGARFCSACGARAVSSHEANHADVEGAEPSVPSARVKEKRSLAVALIEFRRTTLRAVPTFVLAILAVIAAAGTAYAAYRVAVDVVMPMIEQVEPENDEAAAADDTKEEEAPGETAENKAAHAAYEEILAKYRELEDETAWNEFQKSELVEDGQDSLLINVNAIADFPIKEWTYLYRDVDEDGVDELLISAGDAGSSMVHSVYDYIDGEASLAIMGWARNAYYLCKDNLFMCMGSGGVMSNVNHVFEYGNEGNPLESVSEENNASWTEVRITHEINGEVVEDITEPLDADAENEEATSRYLTMIDDLQAKYPVITGLDWQPL